MKLNRHTTSAVAAAIAVLGLTAGVRAYSDITPLGQSGKVVTAAHDDANNTDVSNVRVFGYRYQADSFDPYFTNDPGFNAPNNSGLNTGDLSFSLLAGLKYWDGSGTPAFTASPPANEAINFSFGPTRSATVTGASGAQAGFSIGPVDSDGAIHRHLSATLLGSDGDADATNGGTYSPGVYLAQINLSNTGLVDSAPLYLLYSNYSDPALGNTRLDQARVYVRDTFAPGTNLVGLVPEPASLGSLAFGGIALLARRRRTRA